jgi:hypothetical protein
MDLSPLQVFSLVFTYLVFGFVGFRLSRRFKTPVTFVTWIELVIATILAMYVMPNAMLIRIFDFEILINHALQAIGVGIIIGLATREIRLRAEAKENRT